VRGLDESDSDELNADDDGSVNISRRRRRRLRLAAGLPVVRMGGQLVDMTSGQRLYLLGAAERTGRFTEGVGAVYEVEVVGERAVDVVE